MYVHGMIRSLAGTVGQSAFVLAILASLVIVPAQPASAVIRLEFSVQDTPGGTTYRWDAFDRFNPSRMLESYDVISPTGSSFGESFNDYMDFVSAVEGNWSYQAEFVNDPTEMFDFAVSGMPASFPTSAPVVLSPGEGDMVFSGQPFFPTLDPATVDPLATSPTGFLSRYRLTPQNATASFEDGGAYNGFLVTLDPGIEQTDFRFGYSNVVFADGLVSNENGDQQLFGGIEYWASSSRRTVSVVLIPEPSSLLALACAGAILAMPRRRPRV